MRVLRRCALLVLAPSIIAAQSATDAPSPFAGFETRTLSNGLRVWFKHAPGLRDVSVSVTLPVGSDQDPEGKEQLAHLTEHMLFTDRAGRTEEQIKRDIDSRGGLRNGVTWQDHTQYFARVEPKHGLFAIEWICGIVSPREISTELLDRQRTPVLLEVGARPRDVAEWAAERLLNPPGLRPPDFWKREFGITTGVWWRDNDPWRSVHGITVADVQTFYKKWYVPSRMTLAVIGDVPPRAAWTTVERTCGTLPRGSGASGWSAVIDPRRERRWYSWDWDPGASFMLRAKVYRRSMESDLKLMFVARYLSERLGERLRFGTRKAVYGIGVAPIRHARAVTLSIRSDRIKSSELAFARSTIDEEIERLRTGTMPDSQFIATRTAIVGQLRSSTNSAEAFNDLVAQAFYDPDTFMDYPDVAAEFASFDKGTIAAFADSLFAPERRVTYVTRPIPASPVVVAIAVLLLAALTVGGARRWLVRPLPMARLRYVARIKRAPAHTAALLLARIAVVLVVLRLGIYAYQWLWPMLVAPIDSLTVHWLLIAAGIVAGLLVTIAAAASFPSKVLVFDDAIAIKMFSFRSRLIPLREIEKVELGTLPELARKVGRDRVLRARMLSWPLLRPGVYLQLDYGPGYVVRTRDSAELQTVLRDLVGGVRGAEGLPESPPPATALIW